MQHSSNAPYPIDWIRHSNWKCKSQYIYCVSLLSLHLPAAEIVNEMKIFMDFSVIYLDAVHIFEVRGLFVENIAAGRKSEDWTWLVFFGGCPGSGCLCVSFHQHSASSEDKADRIDRCLAPVCWVSTFSFLFQGGRLPVIPWKEDREGLKGAVVLDFFAFLCSVSQLIQWWGS